MADTKRDEAIEFTYRVTINTPCTDLTDPAGTKQWLAEQGYPVPDVVDDTFLGCEHDFPADGSACTKCRVTRLG